VRQVQHSLIQASHPRPPSAPHRNVDPSAPAIQRQHFHLGQGELFTRLIALALVGVPINRPLMQERFVDAI
jgi:hypothetical protein